MKTIRITSKPPSCQKVQLDHMRSFSLTAAFMVKWFVIAVGLVVVPAKAESDKDIAEAELVIRGMIAEREKLRSGVVTVSGTVFREVINQPETKGEIRSFYAFDKDSDHLRYDNEEPYYTRYANPSTGLPKGSDELKALSGVVFPWKLCYVRNSEYSATWTRKGQKTRSEINIRDALAGLAGANVRYHHMYDIQCVGVIDYFSFKKNASIYDCLERLLSKRVVSVETQDNWCRIVFQEDDYKTDLKVETIDGFRPIELAVSSLVDSFQSVTKTKWTRGNNCDVPSEMMIMWSILGSESHCKYQFYYEWASVNMPVDTKHFDYHSFDVPTDMQIDVVDYRGQDPVTIGTWAGDGVVLPSSEVETPTPIEAHTDTQRSRMVVLFVANVTLLLLGFLGWLYLRGQKAAGD